MCHLCRKVEALGGIDSKAAKPIFVLLSKLHKHAEPRMGDLWLWRHDKTAKLQTLLGGLHKLVPASALKAILDDVDKELIHIKKNMPEHPPLKSTGRWNELKILVTPSQSASARWQRENELEAKRTKNNRKSEKQSRRRRKKDSNKRTVSDRGAAREQEGSDIDPSSARIEQSIRLVDGWFRKCDKAMAASNWKDSDIISIISQAFGGVAERPKLNVARIWKRVSTRSWKVSSSVTSGSSVGSSRAYKIPKIRIDDCVYDKPSEKLDVDSRLVGQVDEMKERKRGSRSKYTLGSLLRHRKAEKLSERRDISITEAVRRLKAKEKRREQKYMMSGGRSPGASRRSFPLIPNNGARGRFESSARDSISLTGSEVRKCLGLVARELKDDEESGLSLLSSRPSPANVGSMVEQPRSSLYIHSPKGKENRETRTSFSRWFHG
jgi:hypothetical protein